MQTPRKLLPLAKKFLEERGVSSPRLDAELLLAHVLGIGRMQLYMDHDRPLTAAELDAYRELTRRRGLREPVAYLIGERGFWTLDLRVDPRVLVPRPETELLIEACLEFVGDDKDRELRIADVGTGSGAIALALASELPNASVLAVDISTDALEVAKANAEQLGLSERVHFVRGDLLSPLQGRDSCVDIIVSNPPYIGEAERPDLAPEVDAHEPHVALFAAEDGMALIRRLIAQARVALSRDGLLLIEHGWRQGPAALSGALEHFEEAETLRDLSGNERAVRATKPRE